MQGQRLVAVVEAPRTAREFWCPLPIGPWPDHVELSPATSDGEIALVLLQLAEYNRSNGRMAVLTPAELAAAEKLVLPGGIAIHAGTSAIFPSCCSGLEDWHEWKDLLSAKVSPWMGHDPAPWAEFVDGHIRFWPDGGLDDNERSGQAIELSEAATQRALEQVEADLVGFRSRLSAFCQRHVPAQANALVAAIGAHLRLPSRGPG